MFGSDVDFMFKATSPIMTSFARLPIRYTSPSMRRVILTLLFAVALPVFARTRIVLLHFSDYHSHVLPFYSEGHADQGGIARAIGYMKRARRADDAIVLSGAATIKKGSP